MSSLDKIIIFLFLELEMANHYIFFFFFFFTLLPSSLRCLGRDGWNPLFSIGGRKKQIAGWLAGSIDGSPFFSRLGGASVYLYTPALVLCLSLSGLLPFFPPFSFRHVRAFLARQPRPRARRG
jgi:hypothetical protein